MSDKRKYKLDDSVKFGKYKGYDLKTLIEKDSKYVIWCLKNIDWFEVDEEADAYLGEVFENEFNLTVEQYLTTIK
jgi:hypothetical protein